MTASVASGQHCASDIGLSVFREFCLLFRSCLCIDVEFKSVKTTTLQDAKEESYLQNRAEIEKVADV